MRNSLVKRKSFFPLLLCLILTLHIGSLLMKIGLEDVVAPPAKNEKPLKVKIKNNPFENKRQIVQSEDSQNRKKMDDSFLSDKDRYFDRETRARKNDIFRAGETGGGVARQGRKKVTLSELGAEVGEDPFKKAAEEYTKAKNGFDNKKQGRTVSSTNDYLEDIPLGDVTNLNTSEYKFYGFYHRIRQKLEQFWGASLQEKAEEMVKAGRRVPASEELITALRITLDHEGEIIAIKVLGTSGIKELDDAAIESFNEAGPFPNPPKDLIVDGQVTLEWGFVVKS